MQVEGLEYTQELTIRIKYVRILLSSFGEEDFQSLH